MGKIKFSKFLDWVSTEKCFDDCGQGGECDFCEGFCCSNQPGSGQSNGNCPAIALSSLQNQKSNDNNFYCLTEGVPPPPTEVPVPPKSCAEIKVWPLKIILYDFFQTAGFQHIGNSTSSCFIEKLGMSAFTVISIFKSAMERY